VSKRPQWRLISDAIECLLKERPEAEQRLVHDLVRRARPSARRPPRSGGR
jgi:hypothetical protein